MALDSPDHKCVVVGIHQRAKEVKDFGLLGMQTINLNFVTSSYWLVDGITIGERRERRTYRKRMSGM